MTDFASAAADYLATRRAMGYTFAYQGQMVDQFAAYLDGVGAEHLTIGHALSWAKQPAGATPVWWAVRLGTARGFARYLSAFDPATEVHPTGLLPEPSRRAVPYIYSDEDIARVREAAGRLCPEHRADTYQTLIALVAVTGMRAGEPVRGNDTHGDLTVSQPPAKPPRLGTSTSGRQRQRARDCHQHLGPGPWHLSSPCPCSRRASPLPASVYTMIVKRRRDGTSWRRCHRDAVGWHMQQATCASTSSSRCCCGRPMRPREVMP